MKKAWIVALLTFLVACASGGIPKDAKTTVISFTDLDCNDCGDDMARTLIKVEGVHKTAFDKRKAELTVIADPNLDVFALAEKNRPADEEWKLIPGAGKGSYLPWARTCPTSPRISPRARSRSWTSRRSGASPAASLTSTC